jgi:hypothetical protein
MAFFFKNPASTTPNKALRNVVGCGFVEHSLCPPKRGFVVFLRKSNKKCCSVHHRRVAKAGRVLNLFSTSGFFAGDIQSQHPDIFIRKLIALDANKVSALFKTKWQG